MKTWYGNDKKEELEGYFLPNIAKGSVNDIPFM